MRKEQKSEKTITVFLTAVLLFLLQVVSFAYLADDYLEYSSEQYGEKIESAKAAILAEIGPWGNTYDDSPDAGEHFMKLNYLENMQEDELIAALRLDGIAAHILDEKDDFKYFSPYSKESIEIFWRDGEWYVGGSSDLAYFHENYPDIEFTPRGLIGYIEDMYPLADCESIKFVDACEALGSTWFMYFVSGGEEYVMLFYVMDRYDAKFGSIMSAQEFVDLLMNDRKEFNMEIGTTYPDSYTDIGYAGLINPTDDHDSNIDLYALIAAAILICAAVSVVLIVKKKKAAKTGGE